MKDFNYYLEMVQNENFETLNEGILTKSLNWIHGKLPNNFHEKIPGSVKKIGDKIFGNDRERWGLLSGHSILFNATDIRKLMDIVKPLGINLPELTAKYNRANGTNIDLSGKITNQFGDNLEKIAKTIKPDIVKTASEKWIKANLLKEEQQELLNKIKKLHEIALYANDEGQVWVAFRFLKN